MTLNITDNGENFETWLSRNFITQDLRTLLSNASILIVPSENLRETKIPLLFPTGTIEILDYFRTNLQGRATIDICITDEKYQEFAFFNNYKRLGDFIVQSIVVSIFVNIFSSFVYDKFIKEDDTKPQIQIIDYSNNSKTYNNITVLPDKKYLEPTHVKFSVTIVDSNNKSKNISYEGPASNIKEILKEVEKYGE